MNKEVPTFFLHIEGETTKKNRIRMYTAETAYSWAKLRHAYAISFQDSRGVKTYLEPFEDFKEAFGIRDEDE